MNTTEQNNDTNNLVTLTVNGKEVNAHNLVPGIDGDLALVHLSVLQKLANTLHKQSLTKIVSNFANQLSDLKYKNNLTIEEYVQILEEELAFHKTVNLITTINKEQIKTDNSKLSA